MKTSIVKILPIIRFELYRSEGSLLVQTHLLPDILTIVKNHFNYQFKVLTCISGVDYPENLYRFKIVYELLSLKRNSRLRLKVLLDELTPMSSVEKIIPGASWWECEIWDMFGVFFTKHPNLTRLLTDYGFEGYPLRKDFPLSGFIELKYDDKKKLIVSEYIELAQEYRVFDFKSAWNKN